MSTYSERWRTRFGRPDPGRTDADIAFLTRTLPLPDFRRVLEQLYHPEELELLGAAHTQILERRRDGGQVRL